MNEPIRWKKLLISLAIPLLTGGAAALAAGSGFQDFDRLYKPIGTPPDWVFPLVWTLLYALMGWACYRVWVSSAPQELKTRAFRVYALQLAANFLWPLLFFTWEKFLASLVLLVILLILAALCIHRFSQAESGAGKPMVPYLLWLAYALYLNLGVLLLN